MKHISILLADDHAMVRMGLVSLLGTVKDFSVVGEAENGLEAVKLSSTLKPDVILMDLMMPGIDGIEATKRILEHSTSDVPPPRIILLTSDGCSDVIAGGIRAGARGAILKSSDFSQLVSTIRTVADGGQAIAPEIRKLLADDPPLTGLTSRQLEILQSMAHGLGDQDIARQLGISIYTVKEHANALFSKLGAANRAEAVGIALKKHLLKI